MASTWRALGIWGVLATVGCSGAEVTGTGEDVSSAPAVESMASGRAQSDKQLALGAVRQAWQLFDEFAAGPVGGDSIAVQVLGLASSGASIALSGGPREDGFPPALPPEPTEPGRVLCGAAGCHFDHYLVPNFDGRNHVLDGDVLMLVDGASRVLTVDLRDQGTTTIAASLLATATALDGWVTNANAEETGALGFFALSFDEREPFMSAIPASGSVYAEWLSPGYQGVKAAIPLP